jgi:hypothetical protein
MQHLDSDKTIVYDQHFGGGGVGLGLLLGPLGAAANASMIESVTKEEAGRMLNRIPVHPRAVFAAVATKHQLDLSRQDTNSAITPYLHIVKTESGRLLLASAVIVEQQAGATKWTGRYVYQLPVSYTVAELADLPPAKASALQDAATLGFEQVVRRMQLEKQDSIATEKAITMRSDFLMPRFKYDLQASLIEDGGDVTWLRTMGGVYGLRKADVSVAPR